VCFVPLSLHDALPILRTARRYCWQILPKLVHDLLHSRFPGERGAAVLAMLAVRRTVLGRGAAVGDAGRGGRARAEPAGDRAVQRSEEHMSELQSPDHL